MYILSTLFGYLLATINICPLCPLYLLPKYTEYLSDHRTMFVAPDIEIMYPKEQNIKPTPQHISVYATRDINEPLHKLLLDLKDYYELTEYISGYTIQVYNGTNRQLALQIKHKLQECDANLEAEIQYKSPNFTLQVGRFLDRLEAYQLYVQLKKILPQAIIRAALFANTADIFTPPQPNMELLAQRVVEEKEAAHTDSVLPGTREIEESLPDDSLETELKNEEI